MHKDYLSQPLLFYMSIFWLKVRVHKQKKQEDINFRNTKRLLDPTYMTKMLKIQDRKLKNNNMLNMFRVQTEQVDNT